MAAYSKFQDYTEQLNKGVHIWGTHTFKVALTNTAPVATQTSFDAVTAHAAPAAANGYTAGGHTLAVTIGEAAGTTTVGVDAVVITATAGGIGPFRYIVVYNDTATSPADALVMYADYGSSITLADGETFTITFNSDATAGTLFTLV